DRQRLTKPPALTQMVVPIEPIDHPKSELSSIAHDLADHPAEMADAQHDSRDPPPPQQPQLVGDERRAADLDERLGNPFGGWTEPRSAPARQDSHGDHRIG